MKLTRNDVLGLAAGFFATISFVPQIVRIWSKVPKPAEDIDFWMYAGFCLGVGLWIYFGIRIKSLPVIVWNTFTLIFALSILAYKIIYG